MTKLSRNHRKLITIALAILLTFTIPVAVSFAGSNSPIPEEDTPMGANATPKATEVLDDISPTPSQMISPSPSGSKPPSKTNNGSPSPASPTHTPKPSAPHIDGETTIVIPNPPGNIDSIMVNGEDVLDGHYTIIHNDDGSLSVVIDENYLNALPSGPHKVTVSFADGSSVTVTISVNHQSVDVPVTAGIPGWVIFVIGVGIILAGGLLIRKRRKAEN